MTQPSDYRELTSSLDDLVDGDLTADQRRRLNELLRDDPAARSYYASYLSLHISLAYYSGLQAPVEMPPEVESGLTELSSAGLTASEAQASHPLPAAQTPGLPILTFLSSALVSRSMIFWSVAVLTNLVLVCLLIWILAPRLRQHWAEQNAPDTSPAKAVAPTGRLSGAWLARTEQARWLDVDSPPQAGAELTAGHWRLAAGRVELWIDGVRVAVEAPATLEVGRPGTLGLERGALVASVPRSAVGFMVATPSAEVVDLGTEFGVDVSPQGSTDVHVLEGQVEVNPVAPPRVAEQAQTSGPAGIRLSAGEAIRISADGLQRKPDSTDDGKFRRLATQLDTPDRFAGRPPWRIGLGNLFDDPKGTSLAAALASDTYRSYAEAEDLGVEQVVFGGPSLAPIGGGLLFEMTNLGWDGNLGNGRIGNDCWSETPAVGGRWGAIQTTGNLIGHFNSRLEQGIGLRASCLLTFNLDEIRAAGGLEGRALDFVCDRAGLNDVVFDRSGTVHLAALISDERRVIDAQLDGKPADVAHHEGIWWFVGPIGEPVKSDAHFVSFRLRVPTDARYLTLVTSSVGDPGWDHAAWSGVRLELVRESNVAVRATR